MKRFRTWTCAVSLVLATSCASTAALDGIESLSLTSTSFQDGVSPSSSYAGTRDTMLEQDSPTAKNETAKSLSVSGDTPSGSGKDIVALVQWDLSTIPADAVVRTASITLDVSDKAPQSYELFEVFRSWTESGASWNNAAASSPWGTAGARAASDRGSNSLGTINAASTGKYTIVLDATGIAVVQKWVSDPSTNHGLIFAGASNDNRLEFRSSEYDTKSSRPKLTLQWALSAPGGGGGIPTPGKYKNTCDGSGAVAIDGAHFLNFSDEDQTIRIYARGGNAVVPVQQLDVSSPIGVAQSAEADFEDAARVGNRVYVISSHGRDKNGILEWDRYKFFAIDLAGTVPNAQMQVAGSSDWLLDDMLDSTNWVTPNASVITTLRNASQLSVEEVPDLAPKANGTNIEGLSALGSGAGPLAIAFRNPRPGGAAIVVTLLNPDEASNGAVARFGQAILLNLGGHGVRAMTWSETHHAVLLVSGPHDETSGPYALWKWTGLASDPPIKVQALTAPASSAPEALVAYPGESFVQVIFDQGTFQINGADCKDASASSQFFTDAFVQVP